MQLINTYHKIFTRSTEIWTEIFRMVDSSLLLKCNNSNQTLQEVRQCKWTMWKSIVLLEGRMVDSSLLLKCNNSNQTLQEVRQCTWTMWKSIVFTRRNTFNGKNPLCIEETERPIFVNEYYAGDNPQHVSCSWTEI